MVVKKCLETLFLRDYPVALKEGALNLHWWHFPLGLLSCGGEAICRWRIPTEYDGEEVGVSSIAKGSGFSRTSGGRERRVCERLGLEIGVCGSPAQYKAASRCGLS